MNFERENAFIAQIVQESGVKPEQLPYTPDLETINLHCEKVLGRLFTHAEFWWHILLAGGE